MHPVARIAGLLGAAYLPGVAVAQTTAMKSFRDGPGYPAMVAVPSGAIVVGSSPDETAREGRPAALAAFEQPQRKVEFAKAFAIGKNHVTRAEFARFVRATGRDMRGCVVALAGKWSDGQLSGYSFRNPGWRQSPNEPVVCVSWDDAAAYAAWLTARTGHRYRLPSEDEWEYAARGGRETARWWGDGAGPICRYANGGDRSYAETMPADKSANLACSDGAARTNVPGRYPPNPYGLHDMLGNAWQWTADCFGPVPGSPQRGGPCAARAIRGGSWHNGVAVLRAATRFSLPATMRSSSLGFRVLRDLP